MININESQINPCENKNTEFYDKKYTDAATSKAELEALKESCSNCKFYMVNGLICRRTPVHITGVPSNSWCGEYERSNYLFG